MYITLLVVSHMIGAGCIAWSTIIGWAALAEKNDRPSMDDDAVSRAMIASALWMIAGAVFWGVR
jgi:hypothetical protein